MRHEGESEDPRAESAAWSDPPTDELGDDAPEEDSEAGSDDRERGRDGDESASDTDGGSRRKREEHWVAGDKVVSKIKELIHEGNVRRIIIRNEEGRTLIEVPLALGVGVAVLIPVWAAIGAVAAVVTRCSIIVEREEE